MNPFPTRQAAENYLARITDPAQRELARTRLGLTPGSSPTPTSGTPTPKKPEIQAQPPRPAARPVASHTTALHFSLPFPPSMNSIWRAVVITVKDKPQARVLLSQAGRDYRQTVRSVITSLGHPTCPPGARLHLHLVACPPDRRARDLSNLPKALEDALTHAYVWADDSLIDRLTVDRGPLVPGGRVDVAITPLTATLFEDLL